MAHNRRRARNQERPNLLLKGLDAAIHAGVVAQMLQPGALEEIFDVAARFRGVLEDGLRRLKEAGHVAKGEMLVGDAVQEITEYAKKIDADLIVVGHKHLRGWAARWWRGSTSASLIEHAPCSVLVVRPRTTPAQPEPILEPPPAPGEPLRTQNAVSTTHVLVPSPPLERKGNVMDPSGAL